MSWKVSGLKAALVGAGLAVIAAAPASAQVQNVGILSCEVAPAVGLILGSNQPVHCIYKANHARRGVAYVGAISRVGVDVGLTEGRVITWAVYAPVRRLPRHALAGNYTGASGSLAVVGGAAANTSLVSSNGAITLQTVPLTGVVGLNVALGIAGLSLQ
jgi:hypothetical protein